MPPWYLKDPATVEKWGFTLTPVEHRMQERNRLDERQLRLMGGMEELRLAPTGEEGILQIKAILGLGDIVTNVNMPNVGQLAGIPSGAVVETNACFSKDSVRPVFAGVLPAGVHNLVSRHVGNQEALLSAVRLQDRNLARNTFANEPLLSGLDKADVDRMFDEMTNNTKEYTLPFYHTIREKHPLLPIIMTSRPDFVFC